MLAIAGGKGGCGKTTVALALTRDLAQRGLHPLLVDADTDMPNVHHYLDIPQERGHESLTSHRSGVAAVSAGVPIDTAVCQPAQLSGGAVLTAGTRGETIPALCRCQRWPGPVIIDTPAGISPAVASVLRMTAHALVVSTDEPASLDDAQRTATVCSMLCQQSVSVVRSVRGNVPAMLGDIPVIGTLPTTTAPLSNRSYSEAIKEVTAHMLSLHGVFDGTRRM